MISDGNGGSTQAANASSSPKIVFTTADCPNQRPTLVNTNGNSSPYHQEADVSPSTSTVSAKFFDADGDVLSMNSGFKRVKRYNDNFIVSSGVTFDNSNNTLNANVNLACDTTYYWEIGYGVITDSEGLQAYKVDKTATNKLFFTTAACNSAPELLTINGTSSPFDGETNVAASTSSISVKFSDADGDALSVNSLGANIMDLKRSSDNFKVSSNPSFNSSNNTLTLDR